jgi:hypothetical protein
MRMVRFLYCLCALLITGTAHLSAALPAAGKAPHLSVTSPAIQHPAEPGELIALAGADAPHFQLLFSDDSEDEDTNECSSQDYALPVFCGSGRSHPSFAAILRHPGNCFESAAPPVALCEAKYLLLGVLRI